MNLVDSNNKLHGFLPSYLQGQGADLLAKVSPSQHHGLDSWMER